MGAVGCCGSRRSRGYSVRGLTQAQQQVAAILFRLPETEGYALAGGAALIINKTIDCGRYPVWGVEGPEPDDSSCAS